MQLANSMLLPFINNAVSKLVSRTCLRLQLTLEQINTLFASLTLNSLTFQNFSFCFVVYLQIAHKNNI